MNNQRCKMFKKCVVYLLCMIMICETGISPVYATVSDNAIPIEIPNDSTSENTIPEESISVDVIPEETISDSMISDDDEDTVSINSIDDNIISTLPFQATENKMYLAFGEGDSSGVFSNTDKYMNYASADDTQISLLHIYHSIQLLSGGNLQMIDENGRVVANSAVGGSLSWYKEYNGTDYQCSSVNLYPIEKLETGVYSMQYVVGYEKTVIDSKITVTDSPILNSIWLYSIQAGRNPFEFNISISNWREDFDTLSFSLIDDEGQTMDADIILSNLYGKTDAESYSLTYVVTPRENLVENDRYYLELQYSGEDTLYATTEEISAQVASAPDFKLTDVEVIDASRMIMRVDTVGIQANADYYVNVTNTPYDTVYYHGTMKADANGQFVIPILSNGYPLPLSAYAGETMEIEISPVSAPSNSASIHYECPNSNSSTYYSAAITKKSGTVYHVKLTGNNLGLEYYGLGNNANRWKVRVTKSSPSYVNLGTINMNSGTYKYSKKTESTSTVYTFEWDITLKDSLVDSSYYYSIDYDQESLSSVRMSKEGQNAELDDVYGSQIDENNKQFWHNFGMIPVSVSTRNISSYMTVKLRDARGVVVAQSDNVLPESEGYLNYYSAVLQILEGRSLVDGETYTFEIVSGGKTYEYEQTYTYSSEVVADDSVQNVFFSDDIFVGEQDATFVANTYNSKNVTLDIFQKEGGLVDCSLINVARNTSIGYTATSVEYKNGFLVHIHYQSPIPYGYYTYKRKVSEDSYLNMSVGSKVPIAKSTRVEADETLSVIGYNFGEAAYQGDCYIQGIGKTRNKVEMSYVNENLLTLDTIKQGDADCIAIYQDSKLVGAPYVNYGTVYEWPEISITAEAMSYIAFSPDLQFSIASSSYGRVRYAETKEELRQKPYHIIKPSYNETLTLSEGYGEKTVYFQFQNSKGIESELYEWHCLYTEVIKPKVLELNCDYDFNFIPEEHDFTIEIVANSRNYNAFVAFTGDDSYYDSDGYQAKLTYQGEVEGGYLFSRTFDSGNYNFTGYSFDTVSAFLCDMGDRYYNEAVSNVMTSDFRVMSLDRIMFNQISVADFYTDKKKMDLTGYATAGSTVAATWIGTKGEGTYQASAKVGDDFKFSLQAPDMPEGTYRFSATDGTLSFSLEYAYSYYFTLDTIAPVIQRVSAVRTESSSDENVTITWTLDNSVQLDYTLLWKNDVPVLTKNDHFIGTSRILPHYVDGDVYKLIVVDKAGNQSEPYIKILGDEEPPTAPTNLSVTSVASKSVALSWDAATDNVAVEGYEIYRDGVKVGFVREPALNYIDKNLVVGTTYRYEVKAYDHALNRSDAVSTEATTIAPEFGDNLTVPNTEYIIETNDRVILKANVVDSDNLLDMSLKFQYRMKDSNAWNTLKEDSVSSELAYTYEFHTGDWKEDDYEFRYVITDRDGTEAERIYPVRICHDYIAPVTTISAPADDASKVYNKEVTISGYVEDETKMGSITVYVSDNGDTYHKLYSVENNAEEDTYRDYELKTGYSCVWDTSDSYSNKGYIKVVGLDTYGNQDIKFREINLDNIAPAAPVKGQVFGDEEKITVDWRKEPIETDFSKFKIYRSEELSGPYTCVSTQGGYGYFDDVDKGILQQKNYYYYVTALDKLGNESEPSVILTGKLEQDTTKPVVNSILPANKKEVCRNVEISAAAYDNYRLASLQMSYRKKNETEWITLSEFSSDQKKEVFSYVWDVSELQGEYQVRFVATDESGILSDEVIYTYTIKPYTAPVAPVLSAEPIHKGIKLSWTYDGMADLVSKYVIYQKNESGDFVRIASVKDTSYTREKLTVGEEYTYKVCVVDQYAGQKDSNEVTKTVIRNDTEKPIAQFTPNCYMSVADEEIMFDAAASSDNDMIVDYQWDFGDGTSADTQTALHQYSDTGIYDVKLTVTDDSGNQNVSATKISIVVPGTESANGETYQMVTIRSISSSDGTPVANAALSIRKEGATEVSAVTVMTDDAGERRLILETGCYMTSVIKDGYSASNAKFSVTGIENQEVKVVLRSMNMLVGTLTSTEMTYDEIVAAGIDVDSPDNQHVYKFATVFHFTNQKGNVISIPFNFYKNSGGYILGSGYGGTLDVGGGKFFNAGGRSICIEPVDENLFLVIYGETHWLKEMFNVELVLANQSSVETFEDCSAQLELPKGLSLAKMTGNKQQNPQVNIGTIAENDTKKVNWYVAGDMEGEYNLTTHVNGTYMPNDEPFTKSFTTKNPLKVWAGSALHLVISASDVARKGEPYEVEFDLRNVSTKPLYNLSFEITGSEQYVVKNGETTLVKEDDGSTKVDVAELASGENLSYEYTTVITDTALLSQMEYYLQNCFVVTMEGSTAEIPVTFNITHADGILGVDEESQGSVSFKVLRESDQSPVVGAYVFSDYIDYGHAKQTDETGHVFFENVPFTPEKQLVGVSYQENSVPIRTQRFFLSSEYQEYTIYIPETTDPYVSNLTFTNPEGKERVYLSCTVAKYGVEIGSKKKHTIDMDVNWQEKTPGEVYLLGDISGEKLQLAQYGNTSQDSMQVYSYIAEDTFGTIFAENEEIWIVLKSDGKEYKSVCPLHIIRDQAMDALKTALTQFRMPNNLQTSATDLPYAGGQILNGETMSFGLDFSDNLSGMINSGKYEVGPDAVTFTLSSKNSMKTSEILNTNLIGNNKVKANGSVTFKIPYDEFGYSGYSGTIGISMLSGPSVKSPYHGYVDTNYGEMLYENNYYIPGTYGGYVATSVEGGVDSTFSFNKSKAGEFSYDGKFTPKMKGKVGLGYGAEGLNIELFEGRLEGKLNVNYLTNDQAPVDAEITGEVGGSATILFGEAEWTYPNCQWEWKFPDAEKKHQEDVQTKLSDSLDGANWYDREQTQNSMFNGDEDSSNPTNAPADTLLEDVYAGTRVKLIDTNGHTIMLMERGQSNRTLANRNALVYSVKSGDTWLEPSFVNEDDGTMDGEFASAETADGAVVLFQNMNKQFPTGYGEEDVDPGDYYSNYEMMVTGYQSASDSWSEPLLLTQDKQYQFAPVVTSNGDKIAAVWLSADASSYFEDGHADIQYALYDGTSWSDSFVIPNGKQIFGLSAVLSDDGLQIEYSEVEDGIATRKSVCVLGEADVSAPESVGEDAESGSGVTFMQDGKVKTACVEADAIVVYDDSSSVRIETQGIVSGLKIAENGDDKVLYWLAQITQEEQTKMVVCMSKYDTGTGSFSPAVVAFNEDGQIMSASGVLTNDKSMEFVYLVRKDEQTDLRYKTISTVMTNVVMNTAAFTKKQKANGSYLITIPYCNIGTAPVEQAMVSVYNNDHNGQLLAEKEIVGQLVPGVEYTLSMNFRTEEDMEQLYLVFSNDEGILAEGQVSAKQEQVIIDDAYFDASPGSYNCELSIGNSGDKVSRELQLELWEGALDDTLLYSQEISALSPSELRHLHIEIEKDMISFEEDAEPIYIRISDKETREVIVCDIAYLYKPEDVGYSEKPSTAYQDLKSSIKEAEKEYARIGSNLQISVNGKDVVKEDQWVTQAVADNMQTAIDTAEKMLKNKELSDGTLAQETAILDAALKQFKKAYKSGTLVPASIVQPGKETVNLIKGKSETLKVTLGPKGHNDKVVSWKSENPEIATVTTKGVVKAVSEGQTTVKAILLSGQEVSCEVNVVFGATGITLNQSTMVLSLNLPEGKSEDTLTAILQGEGNNDRVTYTSSNKKVATVESATGKVVAVGAGKATITALTASGKKATCSVTVTQYAANVTLNYSAFDILINKTTTLKATMSPARCSDAVIWSSDNENVATVTQKGVVKGIAAGTATITAKTKYSEQEASCVMTVHGGATAVDIQQSNIVLALNSVVTPMTAQLNCSIVGDGVSDVITYSSSNKKIATVDSNGMVTALQKGSVTITAKSISGKKDTCKVTVVQAATELSIVGAEQVNILKGKSVTLKASAAPKSQNDTILWSSSDETVATVSTKGVVKGVAPGCVTITVETLHGAKKAAYTVNVRTPATAVSLNHSKLDLVVGEAEVQLIPTVEGNDADDYVTYTSSNKKIAEVNESGYVSGIGKGSATITAKTLSGKKATCKVSATAYANQITISGTASALLVGKKMTLKASMLPAANNDSVTWESSDVSVATVTNKGAVTAVSPGIAMIRVVTSKGKADTYKIKVVKGATGVVLDQTNLSLALNSETISDRARIKATCNGEDTNDTVTYSTSNKKIATVTSSGLVIAKGKGTASITAKSVSGKKAICKVVVTNYATDVTITTVNPVVLQGKGIALKATAYSGSVKKNVASNSKVIWKLMNEQDSIYLDLSENGKMTALKSKSTAIPICAYPADGGNIYRTTYVIVNPVLNSLEVSPVSIELSAGEKVNLWEMLVFTPKDKSGVPLYKGVIIGLSSANKKMLQIDSNGDAIGLKAGQMKLNVSAVDSNGTKKSTTVVVVIK